MRKKEKTKNWKKENIKLKNKIYELQNEEDNEEDEENEEEVNND
ncbi:Uncharacterised protein [Staphylococcus aureus]|nr:Uncharacterised protein [Staphylococcus aureus]